MTSLSVIIPCFNCERTLATTVESVYAQSPLFEFDVTMVDDGSADGTFEVMQGLARSHPRMTVLRHEKNMGAGAARNTAAAHSHGDLIFSVDADDLLSRDFLANMTRFWVKTRCDGLGMSTSVKFRGDDIRDVAYVSAFEGPGKRVRFESFLEVDRCSLALVFLVTRKVFRQLGGYPTEHGFDTQGMGFRFLCHGFTAYTCPDTTYHHRTGLRDSYYRREQAAGRLNWNWFNMLDEFLYLFSDSTKIRLLERELFDVPGAAVPAPLASIVQGRRDIYVRDYRRLIRLGPQAVAREQQSLANRFGQYWLGNYHRLGGRYSKALAHYARALELGFEYRIIYFRMLQAGLGISDRSAQAQDVLEDLVRYTRPFPVQLRPLHERLFHAALASPHLRDAALEMKRASDRLRRRNAR